MFAGCMPRVQLYVNACNGWPQFALQHHWLLPINCHFLRLYSVAGRGIAAVSSAIEESDLYLYIRDERSGVEIYTYPVKVVRLQSQAVAVDWQEPMVPAAQIGAIQLHASTYNWTRGMQPASTPPLQSTTSGLYQKVYKSNKY